MSTSEAALRREIEAREQAERQMHELRGFAERVADATPHVLYLFDFAEGKLLYVNRQLTRMLGYAPELALAEGTSLVERILHPADVSLVHDMAGRFAALEREGVVDVEIRLRSARGDWRWIHTRNIVFRRGPDRRPLQILGTAEDVTERKRSEENLVLLRRAIESANDGICIADTSGRSLYQNDAFTRSYGYRAEQLDGAGGPIRLFDKSEVGDEVLATIRAGGSWRGEIELRRADGSVLPTLLRAACVTDDHGTQVGIALVCTDVSERRRMDERARAHEAELAHVLRLSTLGEMATGLAHELNQPLAGIVSYARGCARRLEAGTLDGAAVATVLERISAEALRAGEIIRRLRALVRKDKPRREEADLNRVVREVARLVGADARHRGVHLQLRLEPTLPTVRIDRIQIEQVLLNLVRNAFEAMAEVAAGERVLTIATAVDAEGVCVTVSDSGPGLADGVEERIFEPFFTTKGEGLGMGLAISRTIIEVHGGRLEVTACTPGATLRFSIPVPEREASLG